jgi:hypothetical protein
MGNYAKNGWKVLILCCCCGEAATRNLEGDNEEAGKQFAQGPIVISSLPSYSRNEFHSSTSGFWNTANEKTMRS